LNETIICTICSREKEHTDDPLPARLRYKGSHIQRVDREAKMAPLPFFILSGRFGLISGDEVVPDYEHVLYQEDVSIAGARIAEQIRFHGIKTIFLFAKMKPSWVPYVNALGRAAKMAKADLNIRLLDDDS
jgi:hypothetical protein